MSDARWWDGSFRTIVSRRRGHIDCNGHPAWIDKLSCGHEQVSLSIKLSSSMLYRVCKECVFQKTGMVI